MPDPCHQDAIKEHFGNATMLTIAHRLNTILHSDKILVLEQGKVLEFGTPVIINAAEFSVGGGCCGLLGGIRA